MKSFLRCMLSLILIFCFTTASSSQSESKILASFNHQDIVNQLASRSSTLSLMFGNDVKREFRYEEIKIMSAEFSNLYPDIKTYKLYNEHGDRGNLTINKNKVWYNAIIDKTPLSVFPVENEYYLDNVSKNRLAHKCDSHDLHHIHKPKSPVELLKNQYSVTRGEDFPARKYRLAIVCTGEYYNARGGNNSDVNAFIVSDVNGIQSIYDNEMSVTFELLTPRIYNNPDTDPFIPDDCGGGEGRTKQARQAVNSNFSSNSYDIGHVFHVHEDGDCWSNGGLASLGVVCNSSVFDGGPLKAGGWSGSYAGNAGYRFHSLASHEFAHMFGATHTFNGSGGACDDAISDITAYEIGSGTTIMSYSGSCDANQNIPDGPDDLYFHVASLMQMEDYIASGATCSNTNSIGNTTPNVSADLCGLSEYKIPKRTPFYIEGSATDDENMNITYTWEQFNEDGPTGHPTQGFIGTQAGNSPTAPNFRCFPPDDKNYRYFPDLNTIKEGNTADPFQVLSRRAKDLKFILTVRDNNPQGGSFTYEELDIEVTNEGPLAVTYPNTSVTIQAGETIDVTWSTGGSEVICDKAAIMLSTDGGISYSLTLASNIDFVDGMASITIPENFYNTDQARIMVICDDNPCVKFFDVSNNDFSIESTCLAASSFICPAGDYSFEKGNPGLNLDLSTVDGQKVTSMSQRPTSADPDEFFIYTNNSTGTGCAKTNGFPYHYKTDNFSVTQDGSYRFVLDFDFQNGRGLVTLFEADGFNYQNACGNFISSTVTQTPTGAIAFSVSMTANLEACKEYTMVYWNADGPNRTTLIETILGPGDVVLHPEMNDPDYSTTIIAVKEPNETITAFSTTGDFTNINGGDYKLYSINYKSGGVEPPINSDPANWIGKTLSEILGDGDCYYLTPNPSNLEVITDCSIDVELGNQTACDPMTNTFSQEIIVTFDELPTEGMLVVNGDEYALSSSPYSINLANLNADGMSRGIEVYFSVDPDCIFEQASFFTSPENCCPYDLDLGAVVFTLCEGDERLITNNDSNLDYQWFKDDILLSSDEEINVTEAGNYRVVAMDGNNCTKSLNFEVVVNANPTLELLGPQALCDGDAITLMAETGESEVEWKKDDVVLAETGFELLVTEVGVYSATVINSFNCDASQEVNIEVHPKPTVNLGDDIIECQGVEVILQANSSGMNTYIWSKDSAMLPDDTESITVTESGTYEVAVSNEFDCVQYDEVIVEFLEAPEANAGMDIIVCEGEPTIIDASTNGTFEWLKDGLPYSENSLSFDAEDGEYVLIAKNAADCETRDTVIVMTLGIPVVDLGDDKIACIGSTVELSGPDGMNLIYEWRLGNMVIGDQQTIEITDAGNYILEVTNAADCSAEDEIMLDFVPGPNVELGDDVTQCADMLYTIMATTNGSEIEWYKDDVLINGETGMTLDAAESGIYKVIVKGDTGCDAEDVIEVLYNPVPVVDLGDDLEDCEGAMIQLEYQEMASSIVWKDENGMQIGSGPTLNVSETSSITLEVINEFDCPNTDDIDVTFYPLPAVALEDEYDFCEGEKVTVVASSNVTNFEWYLDTDLIDGENMSSIDITSAGTLSVKAISDKNCESTDEAEVIERPIPVVDLGGDMDLCPNDFVLLTVSADPTDTIKWSNGSMDVSSIQVTSTNPSMSIGKPFSVEVISEYGCSAMDQVVITELAVVQADLQGDLNGLCDDEVMNLTASGGTNFDWSANTGPIEATDNTAVANPEVTTTYTVTVSDDCPDNTDVATFEVVVFEPVEGVTAGIDTCVVIGRSIDLMAEGGEEYLWEDDNSITSRLDVANPTVSPIVETTYHVTIVDNNGCEYQDSVFVCVISDPTIGFDPVSMMSPNDDGKNDVLEFQGLDIYPDNKLTIFNRWGNIIYEKSGYQTDGERFDGKEGGIDPLPEGTYYYILEFDGFKFKQALTIIID